MVTYGPIEFVHLLITARCRNHCSFCFNTGNIPGAAAELDTGRWLPILEQIADIPSLRYVFFLEREPFERKDITELLAPLRKSKAQIFMCSGGSDNLSDEVAREVSFLIDGFIASYHGDVGVLDRGAYERQKTLLSRAREHFLGKPISVDVNTTVTRRHRSRLMQIVGEVGEILGLEPRLVRKGRRASILYESRSGALANPRVRHNFVRPCLAGGMLKLQEELFWPPDEREWFGEEAAFLRWEENCYADVPAPLDFFSRSVNGRPCGWSKDSQGAVGYNRLTIRWDGKVIPCASSPDYLLGDATRESIQTIWETSYGLWRMPAVVNSLTLYEAFPEGTCVYHQDAAFARNASPESIIARCKEVLERGRE